MAAIAVRACTEAVIARRRLYALRCILCKADAIAVAVCLSNSILFVLLLVKIIIISYLLQRVTSNPRLAPNARHQNFVYDITLPLIPSDAFNGPPLAVVKAKTLNF